MTETDDLLQQMQADRDADYAEYCNRRDVLMARAEQAEKLRDEFAKAWKKAEAEVLELKDWLHGATARAEQAEAALLKVQNAAKTIAWAQDTELAHLRQNAAFDHKLRRDHESLQERDAQMTDALLAAEARIVELDTALREVRQLVLSDSWRPALAIIASALKEKK